jgi:hypothetical protein
MNPVQLDELLRPLLGLVVSFPRRWYGTALQMDLGELADSETRSGCPPHGQASVAVEWDWRIENDTGIVCGSSNSNPEMDAHLAAIRGLEVRALSVDGSPPELVVGFSNGLRLRSMSLTSGDPRWRIRLPDGTYVLCEAGVVLHRSGDEPGRELTSEELEDQETAHLAAARWGKPTAEPTGGKCRDCRSFVYVDGEFALLDYGVCVQPGSPFDGRVVNVKGGCPVFTAGSECE